jgi:hypothetical protein
MHSLDEKAGGPRCYAAVQCSAARVIIGLSSLGLATRSEPSPRRTKSKTARAAKRSLAYITGATERKIRNASIKPSGEVLI